MIRKIFNSIIFSAAIVVLILAAVFCVFWYSHIEHENSDTKKIYTERFKRSEQLQNFNEGKTMLENFQKAKTEDIGTKANSGKFYDESCDYVTSEQALCETEEQRAKDFFCYLSTLQSLKKEDFEGFKKNYPFNMSKLIEPSGKEFTFAKGYVSAFKQKVNTYEDLKYYIAEELMSEYKKFKSEQLEKSEQLKATQMLLSTMDSVHAVSGFEKAEKDKKLAEYQQSFKTYSTYHKVLSCTLYIAYALIALALISILFFIIFKICTDFKNSYTILIIFGGIAILGLICYLIAQPDVTNIVFAKHAISPTLGRFIEACAYITYFMLALAVLSMIFTPVINIIIKNKKLK